MLIYIVAIYRIARLFSGRMFSCLAIATTIVPLFDYFHQGNFTEEYAMPFIAVSLYFFCDYFFNDKINKVRLLICGVCFAAVFLLRANMISVWIVFCIAVLIWYYKKNENIPWHFLIWFLIGAAILTVPILIWLIQGDAFGYFINDYFGFNQKYCAAGNNLFIYDIYNTLAYFIFSNVMLISVVALLYLTKKDRNSFFNIIYWGYIILTLLMISMAGRAYDHYGMILCPMFIYPLCQLENYFCRKESTQNIVVMYALVLVLISAPDWKANMDAAVKAMSAPNESMNISGDVQNILQIVSENTEDDEKIIVIGNSNFYYLASERLAASRYSYQTPIAFVDEEIKEEFVNDLKEQMPRIVIVPDYQSSSQMDIFETREDYELIYITDDNTGVYVRKD